ncbi:MAG: hypothetical protein ACR2FG_06640 [Marmoricola sp.]
MSDSPDKELGVVVDYDPAVWLVGPTTMSAGEWVAAAFAACASDFEVADDTAEATYLRELLTEFATRELASDFRFLRLRGLIDTPLTMLLWVYVGALDNELAAALTTFEEGATYYDREPQIVTIDEARGLRRSMAFSVDDGIRSVVRYHRRVEAWAADVLLACCRRRPESHRRRAGRPRLARRVGVAGRRRRRTPMSRITSYRVVLPKPWIRVPVQGGTEERVHTIVEEAAQRLPKDSPPDQVGPWKRELERRMVADIRSAREYGGVDFYLPVEDWHGFLVGASFVVSEITPPGMLPEDPDAAVGGAFAELVAGAAGAAPVSIDDTVWVRTETVVAPDQQRVAELDAPTRRVSYVTAVPDDPGRWVLSAFSCAGDGDPDSELTRMIVELFDAIMGTWRWIHEGDPFSPQATGEA